MTQKIFNHLTLLLATTIVISCGKKKHTENGNAFSTETIAVKTAPVKSNDAPAVITATGLITTANEARYAFKIGGVVEKIYVSEGQFFKRGQLLATLKLTEIDAQLSQASLAYQKAKRDYSRANNLYKDSVATLEQLQNAQTGVHIAGKTVDAVAFNKKFAYIYAEADGFVTKKISNEGEVVALRDRCRALAPEQSRRGWARLAVGCAARHRRDHPARDRRASRGQELRRPHAHRQISAWWHPISRSSRCCLKCH